MRGLSDVQVDMLLPGVTMSTAADDGFPIESMQLMKFKGERWELFGERHRHPQGVWAVDRLNTAWAFDLGGAVAASASGCACGGAAPPTPHLHKRGPR